MALLHEGPAAAAAAAAVAVLRAGLALSSCAGSGTRQRVFLQPRSCTHAI